jgi:hypothetical protein
MVWVRLSPFLGQSSDPIFFDTLDAPLCCVLPLATDISPGSAQRQRVAKKVSLPIAPDAIWL